MVKQCARMKKIDPYQLYKQSVCGLFEPTLSFPEEEEQLQSVEHDPSNYDFEKL